MKAAVPTISETKEAIIIRIPKGWMSDPQRRPLRAADVLRIVAAGEREFREGNTQEFGTFLTKHYPAYARTFRRAR